MIYFVNSIFPPWNIETPFTPKQKSFLNRCSQIIPPPMFFFFGLKYVGVMAIVSYGHGEQMASAYVSVSKLVTPS